MDFIAILATFATPDVLLQTGYIILLIWMLVKYVPQQNRNFAEERKERDLNFLKSIDLYRQALVDFQEKEDESHQHLIQMINDCRANTAKEHAELMRGLKSIAKATDAEIIE
jgi:hypothetical protein